MINLIWVFFISLVASFICLIKSSITYSYKISRIYKIIGIVLVGITVASFGLLAHMDIKNDLKFKEPYKVNELASLGEDCYCIPDEKEKTINFCYIENGISIPSYSNALYTVIKLAEDDNPRVEKVETYVTIFNGLFYNNWYTDRTILYLPKGQYYKEKTTQLTIY